jgi:hypothetical protein
MFSFTAIATGIAGCLFSCSQNGQRTRSSCTTELNMLGGGKSKILSHREVNFSVSYSSMTFVNLSNTISNCWKRYPNYFVLEHLLHFLDIGVLQTKSSRNCLQPHQLLRLGLDQPSRVVASPWLARITNYGITCSLASGTELSTAQSGDHGCALWECNGASRFIVMNRVLASRGERETMG